MEEFFLPYDLAERLRLLGYDEPCMAYYTYTTRRFCLYSRILTKLCQLKDLQEGYTLAPLYEQVVVWLAKKGVVVRLNVTGESYEVRAREWDADVFVGVLTQQDAVAEALDMIEGKNKPNI